MFVSLLQNYKQKAILATFCHLKVVFFAKFSTKGRMVLLFKQGELPLFRYVESCISYLDSRFSCYVPLVRFFPSDPKAIFPWAVYPLQSCHLGQRWALSGKDRPARTKIRPGSFPFLGGADHMNSTVFLSWWRLVFRSMSLFPTVFLLTISGKQRVCSKMSGPHV